MVDYDVKPEWRTDTVQAICRAMREAQDWSALPILADALQDAGCDDEALLGELRAPGKRLYAVGAGLVGLVLSAETAEAVRALVAFPKIHDCPEYEVLVAAACGHHDENATEEWRQEWGSYNDASSNDGEFLVFLGYEVYGGIPTFFWDWVERATGKRIPDCDRARSFSCSC